MFSASTPKRLRSKTSEFTDRLRLTPHNNSEKSPVSAMTSSLNDVQTPEIVDKPKRRLGFLSRKKTFGSLTGAAVSPPIPALQISAIPTSTMVTPPPRDAMSISAGRRFTTFPERQGGPLNTNTNAPLPLLNISTSLSPIMSETIFNIAHSRPEPLPPTAIHTRFNGSLKDRTPVGISAPAIISRLALADEFIGDDDPIGPSLSMQFPLPPPSPVEPSAAATTPTPVSELGIRSKSSVRRKKMSASVMEELQRVLGMEVQLDSDSETDSPQLAYTNDIRIPTSSSALKANMGSSLTDKPATGADQSNKSISTTPRRPPTMPLPPPPPGTNPTNHPRNGSKRHAISVQLPPKPRGAQVRSCTVTSSHGFITSTASSTKPAPRDTAVEQLSSELRRLKANHEAERLKLLQRIDFLERDGRRVARENEDLKAIIARLPSNNVAPTDVVSQHVRAQSGQSLASHYSVESISAVQHEFSSFLSVLTPTRLRRASVLGISQEQRMEATPDDDVLSMRRQSSPVILGGHFAPISDVLSAVDPWDALIESNMLLVLSESTPSLSASSTVSSTLSSIAELSMQFPSAVPAGMPLSGKPQYQPLRSNFF